MSLSEAILDGWITNVPESILMGMSYNPERLKAIGLEALIHAAPSDQEGLTALGVESFLESLITLGTYIPGDAMKPIAFSGMRNGTQGVGSEASVAPALPSAQEVPAGMLDQEALLAFIDRLVPKDTPNPLASLGVDAASQTAPGTTGRTEPATGDESEHGIHQDLKISLVPTEGDGHIDDAVPSNEKGGGIPKRKRYALSSQSAPTSLLAIGPTKKSKHGNITP